MTATPEIDQEKMQTFGAQIVGALNGAGVVALVSIGRHTGLFDTMAGLPPSTSQDIASAARLHERYVREWLGGMVLGRVIDYDPQTRQYTLPREHAAFLTTAAGPMDLTSIAQFFPYMGLVETEVIASFRNGGGVPYASFPGFQERQASTTSAFLEASLISDILPLANGVTEKLQAGGRALDIGCGAGRASLIMARAFPASRFTGYDFSAEGIATAQQAGKHAGIANVEYAVKDIATFDEPDSYDLITAIELVHDLAKPAEVLSNVYRSLRPGGVFLAVDMAGSSNLEENFDHPIGPALYAFSIMHCMTVSLAQGGAGLGTMVGEQTVVQLLKDAGFTSPDVKHQPGDFVYAYYVARKG